MKDPGSRRFPPTALLGLPMFAAALLGGLTAAPASALDRSDQRCTKKPADASPVQTIAARFDVSIEPCRPWPENEYQAAALMRAEARKGNPRAQFILGVMYLEGTGVTDDRYTAMEWLGRAAHGGSEPAAQLYNYLLDAHDPDEC